MSIENMASKAEVLRRSIEVTNPLVQMNTVTSKYAFSDEVRTRATKVLLSALSGLEKINSKIVENP